MKIFANKLNTKYLRDVLPSRGTEVDSVKAAIAYGNDATTLIQDCLENRYRLDIWMRYDETVPVSPELLEHLLKNFKNNIFCKLVPDVLHSKVIWWKGYGVYMGSANLTGRAWLTNIELGVFMTEDEMLASGALAEIEHFFDQLSRYQEIRPLTSEIIEDQKRLRKQREPFQELINRNRKSRLIPIWEGPVTVADRLSAYSRGLETFLREWNECLTILHHLAKLAPDFRPRWLNADVPPAWQADQLLHAYYYNRVKDGGRYPVEDFYQRYRSDPSSAVAAALRWWSQLEEPPSEEDDNCHRRAPTIRRLLSRQNLTTLSEKDFGEVCFANHSTMDHVRRTDLRSLGIEVSDGALPEERARKFAGWIWAQRNASGERIDKLLTYILDEGSPSEMPKRLYEAAKNSRRQIPHCGINQLAELAGWARPEVHPPRNGRTSKSLRAMGYDVMVY